MIERLLNHRKKDEEDGNKMFFDDGHWLALDASMKAFKCIVGVRL